MPKGNEMDMREITFDFINDWSGAYDTLDGILCSSGWHRLSFTDDYAQFLFRLLSAKIISVHESECSSPVAVSDELRRKEREYAGILRKRNPSGTLLSLLLWADGMEPDYKRMEYLALYYPEQKAYARCGDLKPQRLLKLLEKEFCDNLLVFPEHLIDNKSVYYTFNSAIPHEQFAKLMNAFREAQTEKLSAALEALHLL